jgi:hypothetical protein
MKNSSLIMSALLRFKKFMAAVAATLYKLVVECLLVLTVAEISSFNVTEMEYAGCSG